MADYRLIGTNQTPKDLVAKITGRAKYSEDFRADGMLFTKLLLSPVPRGVVRGFDLRRARAMPGVHAILTHEDFPAVEGTTEPTLAREIRFQGQPIAAIAAESEDIAAEAIAAITVDIQRLPHALDPLDSLRPGGPNAVLNPTEEDPNGEANTFEGFGLAALKWSAAQIAALNGDRFPDMEFEGTTGFERGDLAEAFSRSDLILEEPIVHQSNTHHPLESRSAMAYWQNGKCYLHCSTQSFSQTHRAHARALEIEEADLVMISEYTGGGFGSKIRGSATDRVPAILSRLTGRPVMMRITRDEETYIGRARPGLQGWVKFGFRADGKVLAMDLLLIQENGPYSRQGDFGTAGNVASLIYQPEAIRTRGIAILTNTPPKAAQRGPGGAQASAMFEPIMDKAARMLGVDRLDMMYMNVPGDQGTFGPNNSRLSSAYIKEAIDLGRERFGWDQKKLLSGQQFGSTRLGVGVGISSYVAGSAGFDGLLIIRPDGRITIHSGVGNLGTHNVFDTAMAAAEVLGANWEEVEVLWGNSDHGLPWSSTSSGSQTTHAHTRANWAAGHDAKLKLQEIAARDLGGSPSQYDVGGGRVFRIGSPSVGMTFAQAAQRAIQLGGKYDGHELSESLDPMTVAAVQRVVGQGLVGAATDAYGTQGSVYSTTVNFALVEVDIETGVVAMKELLTVADCGTVLHPRSLGAQMTAGALQGISMAHFEKWAFDQRWGVNQNRRFYTTKPLTMMDMPTDVTWDAVNIADRGTPVGSRGIGEPPVGSGAAVFVSAVTDALGGVYFNRTPLTADKILLALEGRTPGYSLLQTHV